MTFSNDDAAGGARTVDGAPRNPPQVAAGPATDPTGRPAADHRPAEPDPLDAVESGVRAGGSWSPGAPVAARRRIAALGGRGIDAGTKGVVVAGDGCGHCTVRFQTGAIIAGLDGDDVVVVPGSMRC